MPLVDQMKNEIESIYLDSNNTSFEGKCQLKLNGLFFYFIL